MAETQVAKGKPADYGQLIVKRRFRLTKAALPLQDKKILDFGCGNGAQTIEFVDEKCNITAIDINPHALAVFDAYIKNHEISNITTRKYDGSKLPFPDAHFDAVISYEVLEHVQDEHESLAEIYRVLKPKGEIVLSVPNKGWIFETHGARLPVLPWNRVPFFSWLPHAIHGRFAKARIYRKKDIRQVLERNKFSVRDTHYITAPMDVIKSPRIQRFLRRHIFKNDSTRSSILATALLVHARKIDY